MPTQGPATGDGTAGEKAFLAPGTFCFTAAEEEAPWVVGAFGFPSAADKRQQGDNSKGKGREKVTGWGHMEPDPLRAKLTWPWLCQFMVLMSL